VVAPAAFCFEDCAGWVGAEPQDWGRDQMQDSRFIVLDVHEATRSVAVAEGDLGGKLSHWDKAPHRLLTA